MMLKHAPFSSGDPRVTVAPPEPEPVPFADQPFADKVVTLANDPRPYALQGADWATAASEAPGSVVRNQTLSNVSFIDKYGKQVNPEADQAWEAYTDWVAGRDHAANYRSHSGGFYQHWDGTPANFYGFGGWWSYVRSLGHFNSINLQG